jgi:hypothetical protein
MKAAPVLALLSGLILTSPGLIGCSASDDAAREEIASARLNLETGTDAGNVFKLVDAVFEFTGPVTTSITSAGIGPFVSVDVPPGRYSVRLKGGRLVQTSGVAEVDTSGAQLISPNPQSVQLVAGQVTDILFTFALGKDILSNKNARARVGINVQEPACGNGRLESGEECDRAINYPSGNSCDSLCTGGLKPCAEDRDCASNVCGQDRCLQCGADAGGCREECDRGGDDCEFECTEDVRACEGDCGEGRDTCRNICGQASAACWAGCWPDPISCSAICEPPRSLCLNQCDAGADSCRTRCQEPRSACNSACARETVACKDECGAGESSCRENCGRCESCTSADQCPYLERD